MARQYKSPPSPTSAELSVDEMQQAIPRLRKRIASLDEFQPEAIRSKIEARQIINPLQAAIDDALVRTFSTDTVEYRRYSDASYFRWPISIYEETPIREIIDSLIDWKIRSKSLLSEAIRSLEEQIEEAGGSTAPNIAPNRPVFGNTRNIFIVHGHDHASREALARFLEKCEFKPIILHEEANKGRTIIEKFEASADVGFAVILLTPDDEVVGENGEPNRRARQNVILELGYFIGRLGRDRVCALKSGSVELPSDIFGVVWTEFDAHGAWKQSLAKELQAASFAIDWNKVMNS